MADLTTACRVSTGNHGDSCPSCALPGRFAISPERFAVWPQKAKKWHMARLLGVLHKPRRKVRTILYLRHRAAGRLPKQALCPKGLPRLSESLAARRKIQRFVTPKYVRRRPPFSRQSFVAKCATPGNAFWQHPRAMQHDKQGQKLL